MGNSKSKAGRSSSAAAADDEDGVAVNEAEIGGYDDDEQQQGLVSAQSQLPAGEDAKLKKQVISSLKSMKKSPSSVSKQRKALSKLRLYCNAEPAKSDRSIHHIMDQHGHLLVEKAMQSHRKMAALQNHACRVMALLARANPKATIQAVPLILEAMRFHKRNANLQCNGLSALSFWGMAKDTPQTTDGDGEEQEGDGSSLAIPVVEEGAYPVIFQLMMSAWHESNPVVQDKALKTLIILTSSAKECRQAFVSAKAWKALGGTLERYSSKPKIQLKGIKILKYVALDHPSAVSKRLDMVLKAMKTHIEDAPVQRAGCATLLQLAANHPPCHSILMKTPGGGRDAIVEAMQQHESNEDIQKTAILCLQKLPNTTQQPEQHPNNDGTPHQPPSQPTTPTFDAITQGMEAMITTLVKEETTAQTCTNICKALIKLAIESHTNKLDIANANGIEAILIAMKRHSDTPALQRYGCQALGQLASVEATKRAIVQEAQGVPILARALMDHAASNHLVTLHGLLVLVRLSQLLDNHKILLETPIVPPLIHAMKHHIQHKTIQHKAMLILHKLSTRYSRAKLPMVQSGSIRAILQAMTFHQEDTGMQKMGCQCIINLHCMATSMAVVKAGTLHVITTSMARHGDRLGMQLIGLRTITEITQFSCHLQYWATEVGGLHHLVVALQNHRDHAILNEMAFGIMSRSASTSQLRPLLVQAGGIPIVLAGMKIHHPVHPLIQQSGFKTLYNLSHNSIHHGAIIFRKGGWRTVRNAQLACPDDPLLQKHGWTLMIKLLVMFLLHWAIWVTYHILNVVDLTMMLEATVD